MITIDVTGILEFIGILIAALAALGCLLYVTMCTLGVAAYATLIAARVVKRIRKGTGEARGA